MDYIAIYENGYLIRTIPALSDYYNERDKIYNSRYIISDEIKYDLESESSINSILIPDFTCQVESNTPGEYTLGVTGNFDYVLRMKASELRNRKEKYLSICLLKKACEIMQYSRITWRKKDYMRLVNWLYEDGRFDEADFFEEKFNNMFSNNLHIEKRKRDLKRYVELGHDLTMTSSFNGCCSECAKYRKRVYSISGKDKRFPKVPDPWDCKCQGIIFLLFLEDITSAAYFPNSDYIGYSNRPFIDDRTQEEKRMHQHFLDRKIYEEVNEKDRKNYQLIIHLLPQFAPKSMSAYSRMRNNNTQQFQDLALKAKKIGVDILLSNEEQTSIKRKRQITLRIP